MEQRSETDRPLGARLTRCPDAFDADRAAEVASVTGWAAADLSPLLQGAAGCSPYLADLIGTESAWLEGATEAPEAAFDTLMDEIGSHDLADLPTALRQAKRRVAILLALADLGGVWSLMDVTNRLSAFAAACVHRCLTLGVAAEIARGKLPGQTTDDAASAGGLTALAMGKMGAGELNYSSDIDLICLFDETRFDPDDYHDARASFIRVTRRMTAILSEQTGGGYVFRTDLRLRPDASVTPVCLSMEAAERYYESVGRTWERAAYIKAAPVAGDIKAGQRFLETLRPFVWRRHLDFAAIQDAHDMRLRIRDHKGLGGALTLEGHDMKLGRGGIREIEFFTQTRQLIAGGRDPSLRVRGTVEGLAALRDAGWIGADVAEALTGHYRVHREIEHRLQMVRDAQTHTLPTTDAGFARLAAFQGRDVAGLKAELRDRLEAVHALTEGFFAPDAAPPERPAWGQDITARWPTYPALRSDRAREIFRRIEPAILSQLGQAARPDEALRQFDGFLAGLPAGVQLFSLFEANAQLTGLLVDICATAPALAQYLSRNAGVLDAVLGGAFFADWTGRPMLTDALAAHLAGQPDYEAQLNAARIWSKEWHFRIGVHHLRGLIDAAEAGAQYADLAAANVAALWPAVVAEFARKHGVPPGKGAAVVAMGSLGAGRLNALSDLDLIVIYDAEGAEGSDGKRPLQTRPYYARLTQALITALTAPMGEGRLYEVDMRLRPSGRQGPVATSIDAFETYQRDEAWTWEHLVLTRAHPVAGPSDLMDRIAAFRTVLLGERGGRRDVRADVADMRRRLAEAKPARSPWDAKAGPGRLMDIELAAQMLALLAGSDVRDTRAQIAAGVAADLIPAATGTDLDAAHSLFWRIAASSRLLSGETFDPQAVGEGGRQMILRETVQDNMEALAAAVEARAVRATAIIDGLVSA